MERRSSSRDDDRRSGGRDRDDDRRSSYRDDDRGRGRDRDDDRRGSSRDRDDDRGGRGSRDRDDDRRGGGRSTGSGRGYQYERRTVEDTKRRASQGANNFDKLIDESIPNYSPQDGDNRIRILPPTWKGAKHFAYDLYVHYGVGPDRQSYLDLQKMRGEPDPITEERERMRQERDPDEEYIKEIDSKRRAGIYLIDRDNEKEGVQFWAMPWTIDRDIVSVSIDRDTGEVLPIDHPEEGYDVLFTKTGKQKNTKYTGVSIARRSTPLGKPEWLDFAVDNPIPEKLLYFPYEHIAKAFGAKGEQRDTHGGRDDDRGRDRDREDREDRGSRDRDDDRRGSRDRDEPRGRSSRDEPELSWESVHEMTAAELDDLIENERLKIDPRQAKDDDDLADWICEEMKLEKAPARSRRDDPKDDDPRDRRRAEDDEPRSRRRPADEDDEPRSRRRPAEDDKEDKLASMRRRRED